MRKLMWKIGLLQFVLVGNVAVFAADYSVVSEEASATIRYKGGLSRAEKVSALDTAKLNALERYIERDLNKWSLYEACIQNRVELHVDQILNSAVPIDRRQDKEFKQYTVWVRAEISTVRLQRELNRCRPKGATHSDDRLVEGVDGGLPKTIAFVFIACEQLASGGFRGIRANVDIQQSLLEQFHNNGFSVTDGALLEDRSNGYYQQSELEADCGKIQPKSFVKAQKAAEHLHYEYFAYGRFIVRPATTDSVSGRVRVSITGSGSLKALNSGIPDKNSAVVGGVQSTQIGFVKEEALFEAYSDAVKQLSDKLIAQLNLTGV